MLRSQLLVILLTLPFANAIGQDFNDQFVSAINTVRESGCRCAEKYFGPVGTVEYNKLLTESAVIHVQDIRRQRRLNHYSERGLNIGQRVDRVGYRWAVVGENLAYGHESIPEVIRAWIASKTHCELLMDERFKDVGFAKYGPYWVLHFGRLK